MIKPRLSFEFFPPKTMEATFRLWDCVKTLAPLAPDFVSVTYGAGGTTRELTHEAVASIHKTSGLTVAAHLTCVNATKAETLEIVENYASVGVRQIVALRGDPPKGTGKFTPHPEGFSGSVELIEALAKTGKFKLHVGAYPEKHPDAADSQADIDHLKRKIDAGADTALTQFFFDADTFFRFRDACVKAGITAPIIPGILPVENWSGVQKFAAQCGTSIPDDMRAAFDAQKGNTDALAAFAATQLCEALLAGGVEHLHFYTLNKPQLTRTVCEHLGISTN